MSIVTGRRLNYFFKLISDAFPKKSIYGDTAVSMGRKAGTTVGYKSFAFGSDCQADGQYSHAEGWQTTASKSESHAEGGQTTASGSRSHAEGYGATASGNYSHAEGYKTTAGNYASHAGGKYNKAMIAGGNYGTQVGDVFIIGNGTSSSALSNALRVTYAGDVKGTKAFQSSGADYAEFLKPWEDGNPDNEDRVGYFVTVRGGLLLEV